MPDPFGFSEGVKSVASSMDASRKASQELTKQIETVQGEGLAIAQQRARERLEQKRAAEERKRLAIVRALDEFKRRKQITDEEYRLKMQFIKQHGAKNWDEVLKIKTDLEKEAEKNASLFRSDKRKGDMVNLIAWILMAWVSWYLTWGIKD